MASSSSSSTNSPCAACKFLRRKCQPECVFAPYFPPDQPQKFANVHKVFGASNVTKLLNELHPNQREDAVNSLAYEADMRLRDPVYGCVGVISLLQHQLRQLQMDLSCAKTELSKYQGHHHHHHLGFAAAAAAGHGLIAAAAAAHHQQQQQQNHHHLSMNLLGGGSGSVRDQGYHHQLFPSSEYVVGRNIHQSNHHLGLIRGFDGNSNGYDHTGGLLVTPASGIGGTIQQQRAATGGDDRRSIDPS